MGQRILAVDDDEAILRLVSLTLKREGFDVMTTSEPENVTPAALVYKPDLVLCDVMMPNVDGFEVLRRLQEHPLTNNLPVVFLSAGRGEEVKSRAFRSGVVDYITKPFTSQALVMKLRRAMLGVSQGTGSLTRDVETTPVEDFLNKLTEGLRTGVMSVRTADLDGAAVLKAGEVIASSFGDMHGEEALSQMHLQRGGELHFREADGTTVALYDGIVEAESDKDLLERMPAGPMGRVDEGVPARRLLLFGPMGELQESLRNVLTRDGFEVFTSEIAPVGIEFAKRALPEVIVSDVLTPRMGGVNFVEAVREEPPLKDIPILMLASLRPEDMVQAARDQADLIAQGQSVDGRIDAVNALRARIHLLLQRRQEAEEGEAGGERPIGLHGDLRYVRLSEVASLLESGEKSGWVMASAGNDTAAFYFTRGYLVHAELNEEIAAEPATALEAAREWDEGNFDYFPD